MGDYRTNCNLLQQAPSNSYQDVAIKVNKRKEIDLKIKSAFLHAKVRRLDAENARSKLLSDLADQRIVKIKTVRSQNQKE